MKKNKFNSIIIALVIFFALSGCGGPRYYHDGNHHRNEIHHRHDNERQPVGVDLNIHN